jgi:hypothetical protein
MKRTLLAVFCFLSFFNCFAQTGWFLQPMVGAGAGKAVYKDSFRYPYKTSFVPTYSMRLNVGYQYSHIMLSAGAGVLRTGFAYLNYNYSSHHFTDYFFNHLIIPLSVGYKLSSSGRWSFMPVAGPEITYNYSARISAINVSNEPNYKTVKIPSYFFDNYYQKISLFGVLQTNFDYLVAPRLEFVLTPEFNWAITSQQIFQVSHPQFPRQHDYCFLLNVGIKWQIARLKEVKEGTANQ